MRVWLGAGLNSGDTFGCAFSLSGSKRARRFRWRSETRTLGARAAAGAAAELAPGAWWARPHCHGIPCRLRSLACCCVCDGRPLLRPRCPGILCLLRPLTWARSRHFHQHANSSKQERWLSATWWEEHPGTGARDPPADTPPGALQTPTRDIAVAQWVPISSTTVWCSISRRLHRCYRITYAYDHQRQHLLIAAHRP